ncbi:signal recognition particle-docking protein FtsY [Butyricicoccus sp. AM18-35]|nr:signal recognition particle-docking protein FtsY [Butyricicoccus sp. AM18-35]
MTKYGFLICKIKHKEISMGFFDKIKQGFKKTSDAVSHSLDSVFAAFVKIDDDLLEELEEALILSDVGASTAAKIVAEVEKRAKLRKTTTADELRDLLREVLTDNMLDNQPLNTDGKPAVILVIGVNGVGKTTSIGKLAARYVNEGKKVMLSAADTFRAAAADQLEIWAKRAGADIVRHGEGADPAAVVFDSISAAKARGSDIIIVDTAGRLHNKANLMNELAKIDRVISRELPDASRETLLVLDATTGQNAVHQAEEFNKAAELTGIILTKLDGTAKGGIVIAISAGLGVPVKLVGVGEGIDDLIDFDRAAFLEAILPPVHENAENDEEQTEEDENAET